MENTKKLKVVFDFIADYLTEEETTKEVEIIEDEVTETNEDEVTMTDDDAKFKRAYSIMKKMDEIDKRKAFVDNQYTGNKAIREATEHIKEIATQSNKTFNESLSRDALVDSFEERTGITLDETGKVVSVKPGPLKEYTPIKEIIGTPNTLEGNKNITITTKEN